jgi:cytochrome c biogenesis protein
MASSAPPPPPAPARITARQSLVLVWRSLRSMRTALVLLLLLAGASVAGSLIPQEPNSPQRVAQFQVAHPFVGGIYDAVGFFNVFGSWWFSLITVLLFTSLIACLLPRTRATIRSIRQRPVQAREIDSFRHYAERIVAAEPGVAIATSGSVLRRRFFRVARADGAAALAADKGALREAGSLLFHWAFILVLVGAIVGKGTGYSGRAVVIEGQTWVDAGANYDGEVRTGRYFIGDYSGVGIHLDSFEDTYHRSGVPMDFVSRVDLLDPRGAPIRTQDVRVNHPAQLGDLRIFQFGFGWAPVVDVRVDGRLIASGPVAFVQLTAPTGVSQLALPWEGVVKLGSLRPQAALQLELWPDSRAFVQQLNNGQPVPMTQAFDPLIRFSVHRGPLTDLSPSVLDTTGMRVTSKGIVGAGQTVDVASGGTATAASRFTISFPQLRKYSVFQVTRDRGVPLVLVGAILILLGLLPALYTSRRKIWVRAEPDRIGTVLKIGGFALQRRSQFDAEFSRLVDALARAAGGTSPPAPIGPVDEPVEETVGT